MICLVSHIGVCFGNNENSSTHIGPSTPGRGCRYSRPGVSVLQASHGGDGRGPSARERFGRLPVFIRFDTKKGDDILESSGGLQPSAIHDITQII